VFQVNRPFRHGLRLQQHISDLTQQPTFSKLCPARNS